MNNQTEEKKFVCKSCGSESSGTPGTCCGASREEKKEAKTCSTCGEGYGSDGKPVCGCK